MMGIKKLAYDIGGYDGNDTAHYLSLGYRVLCVEAAPTLAQKIAERFKREIRDGDCTVLNVAVGATEGSLPFYICKESAIWNSFDRAMAERQGYHATEISVPFRRIESIMAEFGKPDFMKVDIEGADRHCITPLTPDNAPQFLSFEVGPGDTDLLMHLARIYGEFNLIRQDTWAPVSVPKPGTLGHLRWSARQWARMALRRSPRLHGLIRRAKPSQEGTHKQADVYKVDSAGPTPMEHKTGWMSVEELLHTWTGVLYGGMIDSVWYDVHARR